MYQHHRSSKLIAISLRTVVSRSLVFRIPRRITAYAPSLELCESFQEGKMIKYFALLIGVAVLATAQRSPYAGSPSRSYPQVLPQYRPAANTSDTIGTSVGQRFGGDAAENSPPKYEPYDPYTDQELINRIITWPKEKQPFWYLNREAIAAQRASGRTATSSSTTPPRGSFAGRLQKK